MAEKEIKNKIEKIERVYVIPLRDKMRPVPRYKKTPKAIKTIKEFLVRHMKVRDGDLNKIRIDTYLNEQLWMRGIKKTLHKVKVKAVKDGDLVRVYSVDLPEKLTFKKKRLEKGEAEAKVEMEKQKTMMQKAKESIQGKPESTEKTEEKEKEGLQQKKEDKDNGGVGDKLEEKEKEAASKEATEALEKRSAKEMKHAVKPKSPKETKNAQVGYNQSSRGH